jgi:hypothetical protein
MHDDGLNGDVTAADGIYTLRIPLTSSVPTEIKLQVSAAFRGVILRARSQTVSVFVQDAQAPQRALSALADALTAGDTTTALAFVSPSSNTVKAFSQFTQANFDFLAAALRTATLQSSAPDLRVFVAIVPGRNGQPETVTFRMVPGRNGEWLVENW